MPEGPEVRRYADKLHSLLGGKPIVSFMARTKAAKAWLHDNPTALLGRNIETVRSHGKNLIGHIEGGFFFYAHLLMWGRWEAIVGEPPVDIDRRERARIVTPDSAAILMSAPVFEVGEGEPYERIPYLAALGPDVLPYADDQPFRDGEFVRRLFLPEHCGRTIGAALLDQSIVAGIGNYLRAEILFLCRLNPWRLVSELTDDDLACLLQHIPEVSARAYITEGYTVPDELRDRMRNDASLVYNPNSHWGTHHFVFRRTNLPCLICGDTVRQQRQLTYRDEEQEKERIIYFCPTCQNVPVEPKKPKKRKALVVDAGE
jgi:endonuclease VIII